MIKQKVGPTTSLRFKHQTPAEKRKAKSKLAYETNIYHVKINEHTFQKLEENVLIIQRLEMEKARIQAENDELKDQLMKLSKQMEEQNKKAKIQMEVKDVEMVLLNERIAMLVESNLYLDSEEEQIVVEVEVTTPKTSPLVSSMIKRVKNRETRKEHKDPDFWYVTKRQPKQNKKVDELEPMVKESAKTKKEEQTQHQRPTKQIDTSYPVFHKLPKKSRMKLTSLWATKTNRQLFAINAYKEILMTEEQLKPKFSLSSQAGTTYIFTTSCHRKVIEKYLHHHNPKLIEVYTQPIVDEAIEAVLEDKEGNKSVSHAIEALFFSFSIVGESLPLSSKTTNTTQAIRAPNQPIRTKNSRKHACSCKRLTRSKTRAYTAKRQKREKQDNNEIKKQEDNKEETTGTATTIKQAARVKRQRHHKQEPADEAQKQSEAKEKISEQQQSIEDVVSSLMTLSMPERRSLPAKTQKQEEEQKKKKKKKATREKKQRHQKQEPADEAQKQAKAKERIKKHQQSIEVCCEFSHDIIYAREKIFNSKNPKARRERQERDKNNDNRRKQQKDEPPNEKQTATRQKKRKQQQKGKDRKKRQKQEKQPANKKKGRKDRNSRRINLQMKLQNKVQKADSIKYDDVVAKIL
ncbi:unnamed protein product [Camellia sinensis]